MLLYRRLRFGCSFRRIPLTKGKFAIVDPADYPNLAKYKWRICTGKNTFYAERSVRLPTGRYSRILMHREIFEKLSSDLRDTSDEIRATNLVVDHINRNGLDNRKANLRLATRAQNSCNVKKAKNRYSSNYKGLYFNRNEQKWRARITTNDKTIYLGDFEDEIEAAKVYDKAARKYQGEFAALNFTTKTQRHEI